jgi:O-antigen/teichoic acid export membrane protein
MSDKKTGIKSLFGEAGIYGLGDLFGKCGALLILPFVLAVLEPGEYGLLDTFQTTVVLLSAFFGFGFVTAALRYYHAAGKKEHQTLLLSSGLWGLLSICVPVTLLGMMVVLLLSDKSALAGKYRSFCLVAVGLTPFRVCYTYLVNILRAQHKPWAYLRINFLQLILFYGFSVYYVLSLHMGAVGILLGNLTADAIGSIRGAVVNRDTLRFKFSFSEYALLWRFGFPIMLTLLALHVMNMANRYFMIKFASLETIGIYGLAAKFGMIMNVAVTGPIVAAWQPFLASTADQDKRQGMYGRVMTFSLFFAGWCFLGLSLLSPIVIRLISPQSYWAAIPLVPLIALSYVFLTICFVSDAGVFLGGKTRMYAVNSCVGVTVSQLLNFILIPRFGAVGAAIACLGGYGSMAILMFTYSQRCLKVQYEWRRIALLILVAVSIFAGHCYLSRMSTKISVVYSVSGVFLFPVILWFMNFVTPSEKAKVLERLRSVYSHF